MRLQTVETIVVAGLLFAVAGLLTVPLRSTAGLLELQETFGQTQWQGQETLPLRVVLQLQLQAHQQSPKKST